MKMTPRTLAILFADIGDSTALYEKVGDVEAHRRVATSLSLMQAAIVGNRGTLLRTVGDSSLASFDSCDDAFLAARQMQLQHIDEPLAVRVGFHIGPVIPDKGDVYGNAVNIAARIAAFARTGEITTTRESVNCLCESFRTRATRLDSIQVKGVADSIEVYRMDWQEYSNPATVVAGNTARAFAMRHVSRLELRTGDRQLVLDASGQAASIGRADDNDMPVVSEHASRHHAILEISQGQCLLTDNSTNGTYIRRGPQHPLFVRRDSIVLDGTGQLGLGVLPETSTDEHVSFTVVLE